MTKKVGFLDQRLGTIVVYCNRTKTSGLWYIRDAKGENIPVSAPSFQSAEGGMRGLQIYEVTRGGKEGLKLGLILEGDDCQVYKFETSLDTAFARGMLWGISNMTEEDIRTGQIGINPTPADPARTDSDNASTILYCNMFINGSELPYLPSGQDIHWMEVAHKALSLANRCDYPMSQVPESHFFLDQKEARKSTQQPARQTQNTRSGVSYPQQPLKSQVAPAQAPKQQVKSAPTVPVSPKIQASQEELDGSYVELMDYVVGEYAENNVELDEARINAFMARNQAKSFEGLTLGRKHQMIATLAAVLVEAVDPDNENIAKLKAIVTPGTIGWETYTILSDLICVAFTELKHKPQEETSAPTPVIQPADPNAEVPF
jgi:hypothetical protein